jgi:flagellin-like hook-associated protein FlgL
MASNVTLSSSVRSNLLALQKTQSAIDVTNSRLNTGKKVNSVVDDAVAFFSAKSLDDRASDFTDRKANIDQAISTVNAALTATSAIDSLIKQLKGIATSAKSATATERGAFQTQYNTVKTQIDQLVADSTYQGLNLVSNSTSKLTTQFSDRSASRLDVTAQRLTTYGVNSNQQLLTGAIGSATSLIVIGGAAGLYQVTIVSVVGGTSTTQFAKYGNFSATAAATSIAFATAVISTTFSTSINRSQNVQLVNTFLDVSGVNVFAASNIFIFVDSQTTGSNAVSTLSTGTQWSAANFDPSSGLANDQFTQALDYLISSLDSSISQNNSAAKTLGTNVAILNTRLEFTKEYINNQKEGAGKLTLADTNEEGANLVSLQTRQQLGIQALQFAGQTEQSVLRLFG